MAAAPETSATAASPSTSTSTDAPAVNIGTRRSLLARVQTDIVANELRKAWPERKFEIVAMETMGDKNLKTALHEFNAKALWTHELEALLEKGELDCIVHSLKGMYIRTRTTVSPTSHAGTDSHPSPALPGPSTRISLHVESDTAAANTIQTCQPNSRIQ